MLVKDKRSIFLFDSGEAKSFITLTPEDLGFRWSTSGEPQRKKSGFPCSGSLTKVDKSLIILAFGGNNVLIFL
jgi:hypothetical protein